MLDFFEAKQKRERDRANRDKLSVEQNTDEFRASAAAHPRLAEMHGIQLRLNPQPIRLLCLSKWPLASTETVPSS